MDEKVKVKERNLLHDGTSLRFYADTMEFEGGVTEVWDMVEHKHNAAAVIPLLENGNVLLVNQYRPACGRHTWEIPAGKKEEFGAEDGLICAKRELMEETGYSSEDISFLWTLRPAVAYSTEIIDIYLAKNVQKTGTQNLDPGEFINVKEFSVDELKQMIFDGRIEDSKTLSAIFYLDSIR